GDRWLSASGRQRSTLLVGVLARELRGDLGLARLERHANAVAGLLAVSVQISACNDFDAVAVRSGHELVSIQHGLPRGKADGLPARVLKALLAFDRLPLRHLFW